MLHYFNSNVLTIFNTHSVVIWGINEDFVNLTKRELGVVLSLEKFEGHRRNHFLKLFLS